MGTVGNEVFSVWPGRSGFLPSPWHRAFARCDFRIAGVRGKLGLAVEPDLALRSESGSAGPRRSRDSGALAV
jgi:hypothetical protein